MLPSQPTAAHPFFALPHQHQRDRLWSLFGPPLLDCDWSPARPSWLPAQPGPALLDMINQLPAPVYRSQRLGLMFEQLWQQFLQHYASRSEANRQLTADGRTLGEMDLLTEIDGRQWHLELALKFYLSHQQDWIGPNSRDRLSRKLHHTTGHQLTLSRHQQAEHELAAAGWHQPQPQAVMRGCLFYPAVPDSPPQLPQELNPQHWRGIWCHARDLPAVLPDGLWSLLSKPQWLSPARINTAVAAAELQRYAAMHFRYLSYPLCAVQLEEGPWGLTEQQRWLIMPDQWPAEGTHARLRTRP